MIRKISAYFAQKCKKAHNVQNSIKIEAHHNFGTEIEFLYQINILWFCPVCKMLEQFFLFSPSVPEQRFPI